MASMNYVILAGRLKTDAVKRAAKDGGTFYTVTLCVDDYKLENGVWRETKGEIELTVGEAKAKNIEAALVKDALIAIEGRLGQRLRQGKDGNTYSNLLVRVQSVIPLEEDAEGYAGREEAEEYFDAAALGI
ncbi:MAG: single-stranded DNA-binding protein [Spirochaetaceae bacterium]|jgi:single-stranded DNA-binding protein|nr:single-stranded DNA-binding protein [Spirochaetaceae bacterium]